MNTIIIEHADRKATNLFKQLSGLIGLKVKVKTEPENVIRNPEIIRRIEEYEKDKANGNLDTYPTFTIEEFKNHVQKLTENV